MRKISYQEYLDRVYGCWMGKSIAGTIGAPFEGRKELFSYEYDPRSIEQMLPNDDLDLQVVWLDVMEKKGIYFTTDDLAEAFYNQYQPSPGEYAHFKKNYCRGIMPPVSGWFNNQYYIDGMGCPIRSEIWGCVAAGNMELAKEFSILDGGLDHGPNSIEGEIFFAALEAEAFFDHDVDSVIQKALGMINPEGNMHRLLTDVIGWCGQYQDFKKVRALLLEHWGHADCTNLYQNIGVSMLALLLGKGDFLKTTMMALNCGFDTDCTCATVGAILGILYGADYLIQQYGFSDTGYILEAQVDRRSDRLFDLAEDTCVAGLTMAKYRNTAIEITDAPQYQELPHEKTEKQICISVDYMGIPAIGAGETKQIAVVLHNNTTAEQNCEIELDYPESWSAVYDTSAALTGGEEKRLIVELTAACKDSLLSEKNIITVRVKPQGGCAESFAFGVAGAAVWKIYGPFWHNAGEIPEIPYWEPYGKFFDGTDALRQYHINTFADIDREYIDESDFEHIEKNESDTCTVLPKQISIYEDCFRLSDYIRYKGSYAAYLVREVVVPEDVTVCMNVGHTAPYKLWINGGLVGEEHSCDWWTGENRHYQNIKLKKGVNRVVLKATKIGDNDSFSLMFNRGLFTNHFYDFASTVTLGTDESR